MMHNPDVATAAARPGANARTAATRLGRAGLTLARLGWIAVAAVSVGIFLADSPLMLDQLLSNPIPDMGQPAAMRAALAHLGIPVAWYAGYVLAITSSAALGCIGVALLIFVRKSDSRFGLFVSLVLVVFGTLLSRSNLVSDPSPLAWGPLSNFLFNWATAGVFILFFLFPDGRFVPLWTRWITALWLAGMIAPILGLEWGLLYSPPTILLFFATCVFAQIYRYQRVSDAVGRQQTKWVMFGSALAVVTLLGIIWSKDYVITTFPPGVAWVVYDFATGNLMMGGLLLVPLSIGVAIFRYHLWDIDPIINRTLVYGALTGIVVVLYIGVVGGLGALFQAQGNLLIALLGTALVAVIFEPLRLGLQRAVNRLMYGERDDPYRVISRLGERLEATLTPGMVLPAIVETVAGALKLPYAALELPVDGVATIAAAQGTPVASTLRLPLIYGQETVGHLLLARRAPSELFTPADQRLLQTLARQAGIAIHAARLTADLQQSRERLVTAREEERRRIRRDLHDGLGPTLAALNLQAGLIRTHMQGDPAAEALLQEWRAQIRATIAAIRRLVHELRPPALDEFGLVAALRDHAAQVSSAGSAGLVVTVEAPAALPALSAAVEVAAYRIAQEALTNVARHAGAHECCLRLWVDDALHLEITDDGRGLPADAHGGIGLLSMRERAEELSGTCKVVPGPAGGTRVSACLPRRASSLVR